MRRLIAIVAGRILTFLGGFVGRASNLPGQVALKLYPKFLKSLTFKGTIIAITGSNGKTTTANMIAHVLRSEGHSVVHNSAGANLTPGIATTLLNACTLGGVVEAEYVVLEVDERFARFIFEDFAPHYFVVTNLVRDQVVRNGNPDLVFDKISLAIAPSVTMILNGNDPISMNLAPENPSIYYTLGETARSSPRSDFITHDSRVCPHCFHGLDYQFYHYNHLGAFSCPHCGYATPQAQYQGTDVDFAGHSYLVNGIPVATPYSMVYHYMNMTAVVAACNQVGVSVEACGRHLAIFSMQKDRYDEFQIQGRPGILVLSKHNSVSMDQSISVALADQGEKTVVLFVNNAFYTGDRDISWLYDVTFERLLGQVDKVVCTGSRAMDVGIRLRLAGFTDDQLIVDTQMAQLKEKLATTRGSIYVLAATAFGDDDGLLEVLV